MLADELAEEIHAGTRAPGSALPHITDMVEAGKGSKATVHKAYKELEARGLVLAHRGRGTIILDRSHSRVTLDRYEGTLDPGATVGPWEADAARQGLDGRTAAGTPAVEHLDAPPDVAELLGVHAGAPVVCRRHLAMIGTDVVALHEDWYPLEVAQAAALDHTESGGKPVLGALVGAGIFPAEAAEFITAEDASPDQAARLGLAPRSSVLLIDRITRDRTGRIVELARFMGTAHRLKLAYSPLALSISGHADA
ncbi:GntR family transcriptional regulator [Streptomyces sp. NPDC090106]|uniref:GntR family transcriptional regulator n=1 Tax=Streptomyces sp. NPDC090106 TaxID=3365946 RepID=UPI003805A5ED